MWGIGGGGGARRKERKAAPGGKGTPTIYKPFFPFLSAAGVNKFLISWAVITDSLRY